MGMIIVDDTISINLQSNILYSASIFIAHFDIFFFLMGMCFIFRRTEGHNLFLFNIFFMIRRTIGTSFPRPKQGFGHVVLITVNKNHMAYSLLQLYIYAYIPTVPSLEQFLLKKLNTC